MDILRSTFVVVILLAFSFCSPVEAARHIIIIFDVSSSMYRLNRATGIDTKMASEDIRRVNEYLTNLLFTNTSQSLRHSNDSIIKECDAAYVGKPLYQSGDIITYAEYAEKRYTKIDKKQVRRDEFRRKLPDPMNLRRSFRGRVSYLLRAETEVYDELYREVDSETYWIFVTDGDVDRSGQNDPNIAEVLTRHAAIEDKYEDPMITGILVNRHVKIEVRKIQKRGEIDVVFIANRTALNEPVKKIHLSKDETGKFISETLIVDTNNSDKAKFKLNSVDVEVFDKYDKPLQIANDDDGFDVLKVAPTVLYGHSPLKEFQISLPANLEIAIPGNTLKLEVAYDYNGKQKKHSIPRIDYETVIKSISVSDLDNPNQQEDQVELRFSDNSYRATLVIQSESPNKDAFKIENIRAHIEYKDKRKLCDVSVKTIPEKLNEPFQIMAPKVKNFDWYGNKLVLNIDYSYEDTTESETIKFDYNRSADNSVFLILISAILVCGVLGLLGLLAFRKFKELFGSEKIEYEIILGKAEQEGMQPDNVHFFPLKDGETLSFGAKRTAELCFDVGSSAILRCKRGEFQICESYDDKNGQVIRSEQTFTLIRDDGDIIHIYFEIVDDK